MVPRILKILLPLMSLFILGGCAALAGLFSGGGSTASAASTAAPAAGAATSSVPSMFDEVETSTRLAVFSPAALLDQSPWLDATIVDSQCRFHTPDPPFLVPTTVANKFWTFNGRFSAGKSSAGTIGDAEALEYRSWFGFGWGKQQLNSWPVSMASLSEMPKEYLDDRITMLSDHSYQVDKAETDALTREYIADSHKIQERVSILVSSFDLTKCPTSH
jgi:hypothetical protein